MKIKLHYLVWVSLLLGVILAAGGLAGLPAFLDAPGLTPHSGDQYAAVDKVVGDIKIALLARQCAAKEFLLNIGHPEAQRRCLDDLARQEDALREKFHFLDRTTQANPLLPPATKIQATRLVALYEQYNQGCRGIISQVRQNSTLTPQSANHLLGQHTITLQAMADLLDQLGTAGVESNFPHVAANIWPLFPPSGKRLPSRDLSFNPLWFWLIGFTGFVLAVIILHRQRRPLLGLGSLEPGTTRNHQLATEVPAPHKATASLTATAGPSRSHSRGRAIDGDFIQTAPQRYVDPEIARELLSRPAAAHRSGPRRPVVILFADLRHFTPWAETVRLETAAELLNLHFARMIEVIKAYDGIIVDFYGDGILAFFDPQDGPVTSVVRSALQCALTMQAVMPAPGTSPSEVLPLKMGIGVHVGDVVVGNIGSETRGKFGIVGSAVNLAHRIQNKARGGEVVISDTVVQQAGGYLKIRRSFQAFLKGLPQPHTLHVLTGLTDPGASTV